MRKSLFHVLGATAVLGATLLTTTAASAAPHTRAGPADAPTGSPTTVTFTVTSGALSMTVPASVNLVSGAPGTAISGSLGTVTVTDNRASLAAAWTATASSTAFTTGGATSAETIPVGDATYTPGTTIRSGTITTAGTPVTLSGTAQTVMAGTAGVGDNTAAWNPTISVAVPASAVGGGYTSTLTQSVS